MDKLNKYSKFLLTNHTEMPVLGLGVYKIENGEEAVNAIKYALESSYRMIDTATKYQNEESVGEAIESFGLLREEIFITTKLWNTDQGYDNTLKAIDESLKKLKLTYVDLYLVHWPSASENQLETINKREETWRAMEKIYEMGKAKAIGVSNYTKKHLEEMKDYAYTMPMVNQIEFHPYLYQKELLEYCKENNILVEAYSPLAKGTKMNDQKLLEIAKRYKKTWAQIMLRWALQHGVSVIPKSVNEERIKENINIFDFEISEEDMHFLNSLNQDLRTGWDPTLIK